MLKKTKTELQFMKNTRPAEIMTIRKAVIGDSGQRGWML